MACFRSFGLANDTLASSIPPEAPSNLRDAEHEYRHDACRKKDEYPRRRENSWNLTDRDHRSGDERSQPSESQKGHPVERLPHPPTLLHHRGGVGALAV